MHLLCFTNLVVMSASSHSGAVARIGETVQSEEFAASPVEAMDPLWTPCGPLNAPPASSILGTKQGELARVRLHDPAAPRDSREEGGALEKYFRYYGAGLELNGTLITLFGPPMDRLCC
jgi:hypothetical protein